MRKARVLKKNKTQAAPRYLVFFDSESRVTAEGEHLPYLICAEFWDLQNQTHQKKDYTGKASLPEFWEDVRNWGQKNKCSVWVFAHNLGYDLLVTGGIPLLADAGFRVRNFFEKGSTYILRVSETEKYLDKTGAQQERTLKTINLISSTNFFPTTLAKLGEIFGMEKLEFDFISGTEAEALIYCRRDVEILRLAILKFMAFVKFENLGVLAKTTPGQAFNAYRHRFMRETIILHDSEKATAVERSSYYGGRVECVRIGEYAGGKFFGFDINAMYPHAMKVNIFPTRLISYRKSGDLKDLKAILARGLLVCACVRIKTENSIYPVKIADNLLFPAGEFWTYLATPELLYALEQGEIQEVGEFTIYEGANIFSEYVEYFYTKRVQAKESGDKIHDLLYKLYMNSLYGKFGQKAENWERLGDACPKDVWAQDVVNIDTKERESFKCFGGSLFKKLEETESYNAFCAIAAHVTAYARMLLYNYIKIAGRENLYYMDTDSLFVNSQGAANLHQQGNISDTAMGLLKLEKEDTSIRVNAPKDYVFAGVTKMKGVKKGSIPISDKDELKSLNTERAFINRQWPKLFSCIRTGNLSGYKNISRIKVLSGDYNKGWVMPYGGVIPFELVARAGKNFILPCPEADESQQVKIYKRYRNNILPTDEMMSEHASKIITSAGDDQRKEFRRAILALGGVCDKDYSRLPRWCKRKKGGTLDVLTSELKTFGFCYDSANDLYDALQQC